MIPLSGESGRSRRSMCSSVCQPTDASYTVWSGGSVEPLAVVPGAAAGASSTTASSNTHHFPASFRCASTSRGGPNGCGRPLFESTVRLPDSSAPTSRNHGIVMRFLDVMRCPCRESNDFSSDSLSAMTRLFRADPRYSSVVLASSFFFSAAVIASARPPSACSPSSASSSSLVIALYTNSAMPLSTDRAMMSQGRIVLIDVIPHPRRRRPRLRRRS